MTLDGNAVEEVAALAREGADAQVIYHDVVGAGLVVHTLRADQQIKVLDLEHALAVPRACRGEARIYEPADFVSYVNRLATDSTTLWAHPEQCRVTAVFDDHGAGGLPGWRRHRAVLVIRRDPEWQGWLARNGKLSGQEEFAEFIEDHLNTIIDPDPATMLEISTTFQARRNASFERGTRLQSGDVQLRWTEETTATAGTKGHLEVPERFTVRLAPYLGVDPVELQARLRYRINDGQLRIGYALHRPDVAEQEAFDRIRAFVGENTHVDMHLGEAPSSLHPSH